MNPHHIVLAVAAIACVDADGVIRHYQPALSQTADSFLFSGK
jgi:hypothetical protein